MFVYVIRRLLVSIPVLIGSTIITFIIVKLSGDPLSDLKLRTPPVPKSTIRLEEQRLYLNHSWPAQYWHWLVNLFHGSFGPSVQQNEHIGADLGSALLVTGRLVLAAVIISSILAVITGVLSAVKQYSALDYSATTIGFLFLSMPTFWFAALLKQGGIWYNNSTGSQTFATIGQRSINTQGESVWGAFTDIGGHMVLPVITLGLVGYAAWSRFTRASVLEVLSSDYVRLARGKGLSNRTVLVKHALRTALIPLTTVTALDIAALMGGAIVTETVYQWHGMGFLFLNNALQHIDANLMLAWLLVTALIIIGFNLLADLLYGVLDPRIRHA